MLKKLLLFVAIIGSSHIYSQTVIGPDNPLPAETTAVEELRHYLPLTVDGSLKVNGREVKFIHVGNTAEAQNHGISTSTMPPDSWVLKSSGDKIFIAGGGYAGTLYGVYAFLENQIGIHWWTPHEEYLPGKQAVSLPELDISWTPRFAGRDIYRTAETPADNGRFAARNRLNRNGDLGIAPEYGGSSFNFGKPYFTHTFHHYFPDRYLKTNPEYFALYQGKRHAGILGQLCLTNEQMQKEIIAKLKEYVLADEESARNRNMPPPRVYDFTANDVSFSCQCEKCLALNKQEESEMGTLLHFTNRIAREIHSFRPDLFISTSAYVNTLKPPRHVHPESNVIIRLCQNSNHIGLPISAPENSQFAKLLSEWHKITPQLYVWMYSITYRGHGFPYAGELFLAEDARKLVENGVKYIFWEHEDPDIGDMYALKVWMEAKVSENPYADTEELLNTFMSKYYGAAGEYVLNYRRTIYQSMQQKRNPIPVMGGLQDFTHMTFPVVKKSHELFDAAEKTVAADPVLLQRVREARMGLDRYTVLAIQKLAKEFTENGGKLDKFPFAAEKIVPRIRETYQKNVSNLRPEYREKLIANMSKELEAALVIPLTSSLPAQFIGIPENELFDFTAENMSRHFAELKVVKDPGASSGFAVMMPTSKEKPELPFLSGVYNWGSKEVFVHTHIKPEDVRKGGYNWYKLYRTKVPATYIYFLSSWGIQLYLSDISTMYKDGAEFDVWASVKFQGPIYKFGGQGENGVLLERVILVKHNPITLK